MSWAGLCGSLSGGFLAVFLIGRLLAPLVPGGRRRRHMMGTAVAATIACLVSYLGRDDPHLGVYVPGAIVLWVIDAIRGDVPVHDYGPMPRNPTVEEALRAKKGPRCLACKAPGDPGTTYCEQCGARVGRVTCDGCGTGNGRAALYCKKCGVPLRQPRNDVV